MTDIQNNFSNLPQGVLIEVGKMADYLKLDQKQLKQLAYRLKVKAVENSFTFCARKKHLAPFQQEEAVRRIFAPYCTHETFVKMCVDQPYLFFKDPHAIQKSVDSLCETIGTTPENKKGLLKTICNAPQLVCLSPGTMQYNIQGMLNAFQSKGLTPALYQKTLSLYPALIYQRPDTMQKRVNKLLDMFEENGLSNEAFFRAASRAPGLLCSDPEVIRQNIDAVCGHWEHLGVTREAYVKAAASQCPSLFYQSYSTFVDRSNAVMALFRAHKVTENDKETMNWLLKNPTPLAYSPDNLNMRWLYACSMTERRKRPGTGILGSRKHAVEKVLQSDFNGAGYVCPFERVVERWTDRLR